MQKIKQDSLKRQNNILPPIKSGKTQNQVFHNSLKNGYYDENSMRLEIYLKATDLPEKNTFIIISMKQPQNVQNISQQNLTSQSKLKNKNLQNLSSEIHSDTNKSETIQDQVENDMFVQYHKTEIIYDNYSPFFQDTFKVDYVFSIEQYIRFEVYSISSIGSFKTKKLGQCETTLGNILGQEDFIWESQIEGQDQGQIIVKAENLILSDKYIELEWQVRNVINPRIKCFGNMPNLYLKYFRFDKAENKNSFLLKESEVKRHCLNADFQPMEFNYGRICSASMENPIKIELWDAQRNNSHCKIGEIMFSMQEIFEIGNKSFIFRKNAKVNNDKKQNKDNKYKGEIILKSSRIFQKSHFLDYLQAGTQICLITAMDFCTQDVNLRYRSADKKHGKGSLYEHALKTVSSVLLNYDTDKKVPMYGLCGVPSKDNQFSEMMPFFPLNPSRLEANGLDEIMDYYQSAIKNTKLGNQLLFGPIIQEVRQICEKAQQEENSNQYYVLLILTDEEINDMEETKKQIIKSCDLPISIIFVGLSYPNEDSQKKFEYMEILDGDQGLFDSDGNQASRDMVKFVNYAKFSYNKRVLSSQILDQLPQQFCEYMEKKYSKKQDFIIKINGKQKQGITDDNNSDNESIIFNIQDQSLANNIPRREMIRQSMNEIDSSCNNYSKKHRQSSNLSQYDNDRNQRSQKQSIQSKNELTNQKNQQNVQECPEKIIIQNSQIESGRQQNQNEQIQDYQQTDQNLDSQLNSQRGINQNQKISLLKQNQNNQSNDKNINKDFVHNNFMENNNTNYNKNKNNKIFQ